MSQSVKLLLKDSYIAFIQNSVGSAAYRNFYGEVDGVKKDLTENGNVSCGNFASSVLHRFQMIKAPHLTVSGTVHDIENSPGWKQVERLEDIAPGDVIVWEAKQFDNGVHAHIGFYIGDETAVSTDSEKGVVGSHDYRYAGGRAIERVHRYSFN